MSARRPRRHGLTQGATSLAAIGAAALAAERSQSARRHTRPHPRLAVNGSADRLFVRNFSPFVSGGISRRRDRRAARRRHTRPARRWSKQPPSAIGIAVTTDAVPDLGAW